MKQTKELKQHENAYWHIPKFSILPIISSILMIFIIIKYYPIFITEWNSHNISLVLNCAGDECLSITSQSLGFIPQLLFAYMLLSLALISLVATIKGGFNKLNSFEEGGLVFGLVVGLVVGLVFGLVVGLVFGLVFGLVVGLVVGLGGEFD